MRGLRVRTAVGFSLGLSAGYLASVACGVAQFWLDANGLLPQWWWTTPLHFLFTQRLSGPPPFWVGLLDPAETTRFVAGAGVGLLLLRWLVRRKRGCQSPDGAELCRKCLYDLTGNVSGKCPECGVARGTAAETTPSFVVRPVDKLTLAIFLVAVLSGSIVAESAGKLWYWTKAGSTGSRFLEWLEFGPLMTLQPQGARATGVAQWGLNGFTTFGITRFACGFAAVVLLLHVLRRRREIAERGVEFVLPTWPGFLQPLVHLVRRFDSIKWFARWPIKGAIMALTVLVVCYPFPRLLARQVSHFRNPNALIEPDADALQPLLRELRARLGIASSPARLGSYEKHEAITEVQRFVYEKVPYEWDWNTWGIADYWPTVDEAIAMGKEDCDGRAVVAASLLRALGYQAELVTDFAHVWVRTDYGETMSPGQSKAVEATASGWKINPGAVTQLVRGSTFGVTVFPLVRELVIVVVLWLLLVDVRRGVGANFIALAALVTGLLLLRQGGRLRTDIDGVMTFLGFAAIGAVVGWSCLLGHRVRGEPGR